MGWNAKSDSDRKWYLQKYGSGNLKQQPLKKLFPRWSLTVFHLEIKADSGKKRGREGMDLASKSVHLQRQWEDELRAHLKEQCDSALTWTTKQSRVDMWPKTNTKAWAMWRLSEHVSVRSPFITHHHSSLNCSMLLTIRLDFSDVTLVRLHFTVPCYFKCCLIDTSFWHMFQQTKPKQKRFLLTQAQLDGFILMYQKKSYKSLVLDPLPHGYLKRNSPQLWTCVTTLQQAPS